MIIKQGNKEFISFETPQGRTVYRVYRIDGRIPHGRESCYDYLKCNICGKIIGTQFRAYPRHLKTHENNLNN